MAGGRGARRDDAGHRGARQAALLLLVREQIVEVDKGQGKLRIRIPVTAAALREYAPLVRQEAVRVLREEARHETT